MSHGFDLAARLEEREAAGLRRDLTPTERVDARAHTASDPRGDPISFEGDERLILASNDYLGLAGDERVAAAASEAAREVGTGAGASRLLTGDTPPHRRLERALAATKRTERALVFSSGYATNLGTVAALAPDVVFSDRFNHASIVDACRQARADVVVYDHCDPADLRARMDERARTVDAGAGDARGSATGASDAGESWLVVTDTVFSMDGDVAPLSAVCDAAEAHGAWVMVDEAHATGLYGDGGGIVQRAGLGDRIDVQMGTLSKALAAQGGYVAGEEALVEYLANAARSFVFSTGLAPPAAAAAREALSVAREGDRRERLWERVETLRDGLEAMGYEVAGSTQILPVMVGDREATMALDRALADRGVLAPGIRPPTVPEGTSRIRVAPTAAHTDEDVERCLSAFRAAGEEVGLL